MDRIDIERARSLKFVQVIFALLALLSLIASLAVAIKGVEFGLPDTSTTSIAIAFLFVGAMDTALLYGWEFLFERMRS